ncbi:MAG TPA: YfhO family protein, partial [Pyrinomonadaceae bacterium]|nr:YfhO family protein [Pyrinomonadaceae bacterium]
SMPRRAVLTFLAPYSSGGGDGRIFLAPYVGPPFYAEFVAYAGALAMMLALLAVWLKREARTLFWASAAVICLLLALGGNAPFGLYKLIYHVPLLNLFRVPARHLMEVNFALAVLAGRGLTFLGACRREGRVWPRVAAAGAIIFVLTCLAVTWLRPPGFRLGRVAPISFLRAPELFVPVVIAGLSAWALWFYARDRGRLRASALVLAVLALDLLVWGQSSGWRVNNGPPPGDEYWRVPETVRLLRERERQDPAPYRILTVPHTFDPARAPIPPAISHSTDWVPWTQPDIYMMHGVENAAGYDGFGFARYGRLAGEMKVWGELTYPNQTLRGASREIDLLNVRYLLSMRPGQNAQATSESPDGFILATREYGGYMFAESILNVPYLSSGRSLSFTLPPIGAERVALVTALAWSAGVPDDAVVAHLRLYGSDGQVFDFQLRAGADTAEWSYDRPDAQSSVLHRRATIATSYEVADVAGSYEAHTYVTSFALPAKAKIAGGEITLEQSAEWPNLSLSVQRVSLVGAGGAYPLRDDWVQQGPREQALSPQDIKERWRLIAQTPWVDVYENRHSLPRAWLATSDRTLTEQEQLEVIRSGRLPGGESWEPLQTALVESETFINGGVLAASDRAEVMRHEPNRVEVRTRGASPSILVLSENYYPGWRATVDGQRAEILRVNYNLRGVALPAGEHTVEFVYRPGSVLYGLIISLVTLALLVAWWSGRWQRRARTPKESREVK